MVDEDRLADARNRHAEPPTDGWVEQSRQDSGHTAEIRVKGRGGTYQPLIDWPFKWHEWVNSIEEHVREQVNTDDLPDDEVLAYAWLDVAGYANEDTGEADVRCEGRWAWAEAFDDEGGV